MTIIETVVPFFKTVSLFAVLAYSLTYLVPVVHYDVWHEMALAREIKRTGHVPWKDPFSYAPTRSVIVDHEWLAGVAALTAYKQPHGLFVLWLGLIALLFGIVFRFLKKLPVARGLGAGLIAAPMVMVSHAMPVIAQAYSVIFTGFLIGALEGLQRGKRLGLLLFIPLFIFWVNFHGGVIVAFVILAAWIGERWIRRQSYWELVFFLGLLFVLISVNPFGFNYYRHLYESLVMPRPSGAEWQSDWLWSDHSANSLGGRFEFLLSLIIFAKVISGSPAGFQSFKRSNVQPKKDRHAYFGTWAVLITALLTVRAHKMMPFYALCWVFWVSHYTGGERFRISRFAGAVSLFLIPFCAYQVFQAKLWEVRVPGTLPDYGVKSTQPLGPVRFLQEHQFRGHLMTSFHNGGYISWRMYPDVQVSCDARYDVAYPPQDVVRNLEMYFKTPSLVREELLRLPTTDAILCPVVSLLGNEMKRLHWREAYRDDQFTLYLKPETPGKLEDRRGEKIFEIH